jgi:hypothetical protein
LPAGGVGGSLGPRVSRSRFSGGVDEAMAAASRRNKSSRTLPRPVEAPLRRRRRVCGGGTPDVESLCRSRSSVAIDLGVRRDVVIAGALVQGWRGGCVVCGNAVDGSTSTSLWRRLSSTARYDPRPRGLGARPRPMSFQWRHISFLGTSDYFGYLQSLCAMESSRFCDSWRLVILAPGGVHRRWIQATSASTGFSGFSVISTFSKSLCVIWYG